MSDQKAGKTPTKTQTTRDKQLDSLREQTCANMNTRIAKSAFDPLCSIDKANFASATLGSGELVEVCGLEAAKFCSQGITAAVPQAGASMGAATAITDCQMTAWNTACGQANLFDKNPKSSMFNQRLFGLLPEACYCKCKEACTEGQSSVLGGSFAQQYQTGEFCSLADIRSGRCKNWSCNGASTTPSR
jgi:hypothetical protein